MQNSSSRMSFGIWLAGILFGLPCIAIPSQVSASEETDSAKFSFLGSPVALYPNATLTSDYIARGFTQTLHDPAIQGGIDAYWRSFYFGVWASQVDFGKVNGHRLASAEIDLYGGIIRNYGGFNFDIGAIYYIYPSAYDPAGEFDFWDIKFGVSRVMGEGTTIGFTSNYSPEYSGKTGKNWINQAKLSHSLPKLELFSPTITSTIGYQDGEERAGGFDYGFWDVGLTLGFRENYKLDLRYHDTFDVPFSCTNICEERFIISLTAVF